MRFSSHFGLHVRMIAGIKQSMFKFTIKRLCNLLLKLFRTTTLDRQLSSAWHPRPCSEGQVERQLLDCGGALWIGVAWDHVRSYDTVAAEVEHRQVGEGASHCEMIYRSINLISWLASSQLPCKHPLPSLLRYTQFDAHLRCFMLWKHGCDLCNSSSMIVQWFSSRVCGGKSAHWVMTQFVEVE